MTNFTDTHPEGYDPIRDGGADYGYDPENDDDDDYTDEERFGHQRYSQGFSDGFDYALTLHPPLSRRLEQARRRYRRARYQLRMKFFAIRRKVLPQPDDDIPF